MESLSKLICSTAGDHDLMMQWGLKLNHCIEATAMLK